jgi:hypothetical protein
MVLHPDPPDAVRHAVGLYSRGVVCAAEMWFQVARVLTPGSVAATLDALPADTRKQLRAVFADRPFLPEDPEFAQVVAELVVWCEGGRGEPDAAPDYQEYSP